MPGLYPGQSHARQMTITPGPPPPNISNQTEKDMQLLTFIFAPQTLLALEWTHFTESAMRHKNLVFKFKNQEYKNATLSSQWEEVQESSVFSMEWFKVSILNQNQMSLIISTCELITSKKSISFITYSAFWIYMLSGLPERKECNSKNQRPKSTSTRGNQHRYKLGQDSRLIQPMAPLVIPEPTNRPQRLLAHGVAENQV